MGFGGNTPYSTTVFDKPLGLRRSPKGDELNNSQTPPLGGWGALKEDEKNFEKFFPLLKGELKYLSNSQKIIPL